MCFLYSSKYTDGRSPLQVEKLLKAAEENLKTETEAKKSMADLESKISALEVNLQVLGNLKLGSLQV